MWFCERQSGIRVAAAAGLMAAGFGLIAGCQVRPLYETASPAAARYASIGISEPTTRVGQQVRNQLIFLFSGGAGEPSSPTYRLDLTVRSTPRGVFIDQATDSATAATLQVTASYTLKEAATGKVLKRGSRTATSAFDLPPQEFAKIRAQRDAEDRAGREAAELVRADLASVLAR
jgi:LPS-assembly lipoprotein